MATISGEYGVRPRFDIRGREATMWLIAINVSIFLIVWIVGTFTGDDNAADYLALPAAWAMAVRRPWTLLTYMVTHESLLHILFNMLWLFWFGTMSERTIGPWRLVGAYIAGGITGGLAYLATASVTPLIPASSQLVGASASVLCIMTATALRTPDLEVNLLLAGPIRLKWFALLCILLAMLGLGGGNSGGVAAHLGGVVTGAVTGLRERGALQRLELKTRLRMNRHKVRRLQAEMAAKGPVVTTPASPEERLDTLLDKIKTSGYASLSSAERDELTRLSHKL